jgi:hypothetical protein
MKIILFVIAFTLSTASMANVTSYCNRLNDNQTVCNNYDDQTGETDQQLNNYDNSSQIRKDNNK